MKKFGIKAKIWAGYGVLACVLVVSTWMTYDNSRSLVAVNQASDQMVHRRDVVDSLVCAMLETSNAERAVLLGNAEAWPHFDRSLTEVMTKAQQLRQLLVAGNQRKRVDTLLVYMQQKRDNTQKVTELLGADHREAYYRSRVEALQDGRDSVVIHPKTTGNVLRHETVYEVERSKRGFFRRLGDAFRRQHADTVGITTIAHQAQADSMQQAIDIADSVAHVLADIQQAEKQASNRRQDAVTSRYRRLQQVSLMVADRTGQLLRDIQKSEQRALRKAVDQSMTSREGAILRIVLLALMAIGSAAILLTYILRDVRRDRLHRQRLVEAKAETEKLMLQRERLLLTITHDIKAPAASIAGFIELLQPYVQGAKATGYLNNIGSSASHLHRLVSALLDYHLLESGKAELHNVSFVPLRLANEVVGEMRPMAQAKNLTLHTDADEGAQRMCRADAFRVKQILNNLVGNALKYTDEGGVTITLRLVAGWLTLAVTDTGRGMTSDEQQRVFDACLLKPFSMHTLAATLTQITRQPFVPNDVAPETETDSAPDFFAPLTAFAEGDVEAERDILTQTLKALDEYLALLTPSSSNNVPIASNNMPEAERHTAYINKVAKAAHKALPLLTMLMPQQHDAFLPITPGNIALTAPNERERLAQQLKAVLEHIRGRLCDKLNINKPLCN